MFEDLKIGDNIKVYEPYDSKWVIHTVEKVSPRELITNHNILTPKAFLGKGWIYRKLENQAQKPEIPDFLVPGAEVEVQIGGGVGWYRETVDRVRGSGTSTEIWVKSGGYYMAKQNKWRKPQDTEERPRFHHPACMPGACYKACPIGRLEAHYQQEEQAQREGPKFLPSAEVICDGCGSIGLSFEPGHSKLNQVGDSLREFRLGLIRNGGRIGVGEGERP
jgi:hypothetical protein